MSNFSCRSAVIRLEYGQNVGYGHLTRCIALAEQLYNHNFQIYFLSKSNQPLSHQIFDKKFTFLTINDEFDLQNKLIELYPDILVVDLLEKNSNQEEFNIIQNCVTTVKASVCFDNYHSEKIPFDLFIGPKFFSKTENINRLEGLQYILFRDTFLAKRTDIRCISRDSAALISLGNIDPFDISYCLVDLIVNLLDTYSLYVVIGSGFSEWNKKCLFELEKKFDNLTTVANETDLSSYFGRCDIAFVSGGQSKFEASLLGSYPMIISNTDEELEAGSIYREQELGTFLCDARHFDPIVVSQKISFVVANQELLLQRRQRAFKKLDGRGGERIVQRLIELYEQRR